MSSEHYRVKRMQSNYLKLIKNIEKAFKHSTLVLHDLRFIEDRKIRSIIISLKNIKFIKRLNQITQISFEEMKNDIKKYIQYTSQQHTFSASSNCSTSSPSPNTTTTTTTPLKLSTPYIKQSIKWNRKDIKNKIDENKINKERDEKQDSQLEQSLRETREERRRDQEEFKKIIHDFLFDRNNKDDIMEYCIDFDRYEKESKFIPLKNTSNLPFHLLLFFLYGFSFEEMFSLVTDIISMFSLENEAIEDVFSLISLYFQAHHPELLSTNQTDRIKLKELWMKRIQTLKEKGFDSYVDIELFDIIHQNIKYQTKSTYFLWFLVPVEPNKFQLFSLSKRKIYRDTLKRNQTIIIQLSNIKRVQQQQTIQLSLFIDKSGKFIFDGCLSEKEVRNIIYRQTECQVETYEWFLIPSHTSPLPLPSMKHTSLVEKIQSLWTKSVDDSYCIKKMKLHMFPLKDLDKSIHNITEYSYGVFFHPLNTSPVNHGIIHCICLLYNVTEEFVYNVLETIVKEQLEKCINQDTINYKSAFYIMYVVREILDLNITKKRYVTWNPNKKHILDVEEKEMKENLKRIKEQKSNNEFTQESNDYIHFLLQYWSKYIIDIKSHGNVSPYIILLFHYFLQLTNYKPIYQVYAIVRRANYSSNFLLQLTHRILKFSNQPTHTFVITMDYDQPYIESSFHPSFVTIHGNIALKGVRKQEEIIDYFYQFNHSNITLCPSKRKYNDEDVDNFVMEEKNINQQILLIKE